VEGFRFQVALRIGRGGGGFQLSFFHARVVGLGTIGRFPSQFLSCSRGVVGLWHVGVGLVARFAAILVVVVSVGT
jgi:hypothetical protein